MYKKALKIRLILVVACYLVFFGFILYRLLTVQVLKNENFVRLADAQHYLTLTLAPQRGQIFDRNEKVLAMSLNVFSVYAVPYEITEKTAFAAALAPLLRMPAELIQKRISTGKKFVWLKRRIAEEDAAHLQKLRLPGIGFRRESKRYYPDGKLAAHVIGYAGIDDQGLDGAELAFDRYLKGRPGKRSLLRDAKQRILPAFEQEYVPAVDGLHVVLTLDEVIQHIVEEELENYFQKNRALAAWVVVMNPHNGEIYALANWPAHDLNDIGAAAAADRRNKAVCDLFEPGSTFKIVTACAALEERKFGLDDVIFCENGEYRIARHTLHDHKPYGNLTFVGVIEHSSNIGMVKIAQKLGNQVVYDYAKKFGFGELTGIDLPGESRGIFSHPSKWSKLSIGAIPIGHEVAVTSLQMVRAMAVIANGGYLVRPHVVMKIINGQRQDIETADFQRQRTPALSAQTAQTMRNILQGVVDRGTGKKAAIPGYTVAGKTGTAQKLLPGGGYSHSNFIASFIGFAPADMPRLVAAVVVDDPKPLYYGGLVAAPLFKNIAERTLKYLNVPQQMLPAKDAATESELLERIVE
ncbi:MAG: penicillin-binding protein 2 [Candidatus Omnitrophica bacterium]|nr:penicillin-binding protein 2 [Candidatus Omnitrophota bacterium]